MPSQPPQQPPASRPLTSLVGRVGLDYFRRLLPPLWLALAVVAAGLLWMAASSQDLIALAAFTVALTGAFTHWPRRRQYRWPLWRTVVLALAAALELVPAWSGNAGLRDLLFAAAAWSLLHAAWRLFADIRLALRLQRAARALDDASLLALLPREAHEDALRWQHGDDSKSAELSLVVNLAALWNALAMAGKAGARMAAPL